MDQSPPKRGLGALLQSTTSGPAISADPKTNVMLISTSSVRPNADQPRRSFNEGALAELANSIKLNGIIQPIVVRQLPPTEISGDVKYELIAGERRWRACKRAEVREVPAVIRPTTKTLDVLVLSLIENLQRDDLNPIDEALALKKLKSAHGMTQEQIADAVSKSRTSVANSLRLLDLPDPIQRLIQEGEISVGHAKVLLGIPDDKVMLQMATRTKAEQLSVRQLEMLVVGKKSLARKSPNLKDSLNLGNQDKRSHVHFIESRLRTHFGTKVHIEEGVSKGKITIEFYSIEDFDRITKLMGLTDT